MRIGALRANSAGDLLESFAQALWEAGYATITARRHLRAAEHLNYWTHRQDMLIREPNKQLLSRFVSHLNRCRCGHYGHANRREVIRGVRVFLAFLKDGRMITTRVVVKPVEKDPVLLSAFCQWMREQRGTCDATDPLQLQHSYS